MTQSEKDDMKKIVEEGMNAAKREGMLHTMKAFKATIDTMGSLITVEVIVGILDEQIKELEK